MEVSIRFNLGERFLGIHGYEVACLDAESKDLHSSLNVFDDGAVLLRSFIWTLSIVLMFCNHNVSRDGSSVVIRWNLLYRVRSIELASIGGPDPTE
jgi:hypothetical protein